MFYKSVAYFTLIITNLCDIFVINKQYERLSNSNTIKIPPVLNKHIDKSENIEKTKFYLLERIAQKLCLLLLVSTIFLIPNFLPWLWLKSSELRPYLDVLMKLSEREIAFDRRQKHKNEAEYINISINIFFSSLFCIWLIILKVISVFLGKFLFYYYYHCHYNKVFATALKPIPNEKKTNKLVTIIYFIVITFYSINNTFNIIVALETKNPSIVYAPLYTIIISFPFLLIVYIMFFSFQLIPKRNVKKLGEKNLKLRQDIMELCNNNKEYGLRGKVSDIYITNPTNNTQDIIELCGLPLKKKKLYLTGNIFESCCDTDKTEKDDQIFALVLFQLLRKKEKIKKNFFPFISALFGLLILFGIFFLVQEKYEFILASFGFVLGKGSDYYSIESLGMKYYPQIGIFSYSLIFFYPLVKLWFTLFRWVNKKRYYKLLKAVIDQGYGLELYDAFVNCYFKKRYNNENILLLDSDPLYTCYYSASTIESYVFLDSILGLEPREDVKQDMGYK
ncbi:uncharacterized protein SCDLUD_005309 [Saccharomycodes ludwigii]|uniref:uncharacterized protein n=1 Tax=Saccharomycodes ludwigii TaxID=36035 RepID=UPI001E868C02|nr:hypothetical protein SCDLUD_005309 [Saccharomycodes ludwigii]KAH3898962.1 hypothetical protein SCDLUD_005309 [Saccharomycodes ludwigii]